MNIDVAGLAWNALVLVGLLFVCVLPFALIIGFFRVGWRRFSGRRGRHDAFFEGVGRANAMNSHLMAGTPEPDELAVPVARDPFRRRRRRRHH